MPAINFILILMIGLTEFQLNKMMLDMRVLERKNGFYHVLCSIFRIIWISLCGWIALPLPIYLIGLSILLYINVLPYKNRRLMLINFTTIIYLLYVSLLMLVIGCTGLLGYSYTTLMEETFIRIIVLCTTFLLHNLTCALLLRYRPGFLWSDDFDRLKVLIYTLFLCICILYHLIDAIVLTLYETIHMNYLLLTSGDILILFLMFMFLNNNHIFVKSEMMKKQYEESEILVAQQYFEKENLKQLSEHDSLTLAYNRREICSIMQTRMMEGHQLACIFIDIDGLKRINDTYGHSYGDMMLKRFADACHKIIRDNGYLARIGGDEFLLVFFNRNIKDIEADIKKLQLVLLQDEDQSKRVYFSYGISFNEKTVDDYITSADKKMYISKKEKRGDRS